MRWWGRTVSLRRWNPRSSPTRPVSTSIHVGYLLYLKGKVYVPYSVKSVGWVLISLQAVSPQVDKPLKSVTHGQCDTRPTVTFPAAGHHCCLTGTKGTCAWTTCLELMRSHIHSLAKLQLTSKKVKNVKNAFFEMWKKRKIRKIRIRRLSGRG